MRGRKIGGGLTQYRVNTQGRLWKVLEAKKKRTEECLFRRRRLGDTPAHGEWAGGHGGGAACKDVVQPICTPGSKPLNEDVKPGSGMWKTASGEPSEEQGGREGKRVTERVWPGWWQRGSSRALASGRR